MGTLSQVRFPFRQFFNSFLGIDLDVNGVTANDPGDSDTGANNLQNFPVLTSAASSGGSTTLQGTLNSTPNTTFRLEFFANTACDPSGHGEGERFLGAQAVTTDGSGNASFTAPLSPAVPAGEFITATATDPANNTSEFSNCTSTGADLSLTKVDSPDPVTTGGIITYTITITNNGPSAATDAALNDTVPTKTTFQSLTAPAGWSCMIPVVGGTGNVRCTNPSLASGATASFTLRVKVNASMTAGTTITNTASASTTTADPVATNNSATATTVVVKTSQLYRLGVTVTGNGMGSVTSNPAGINCPGDCTESYGSGTAVTLTATPKGGARFAGWAGDCQAAGTNPSCVVTMTADRTVKATFKR